MAQPPASSPDLARLLRVVRPRRFSRLPSLIKFPERAQENERGVVRLRSARLDIDKEINAVDKPGGAVCNQPPGRE